MKKAEIHVSDIRTFWKCRYQWSLSSSLRRNLEPDRLYAPFITGRAIHYALEQYYRQRYTLLEGLAIFEEKERPTIDALDEELFSEQMQLATGMLEHYDVWIHNAPQTTWSDDKFDFLKWEHEWKLPLMTPTQRLSPNILLGGRFDGLVRRKDDNTLWLWETKTTRSIQELADTLWNDLQATIYCWAAQTMYHEPIAGVIYNIMRKKVPARPRVLQSGLLSQAMNQDTTPEYYRHCALEHHGEDDSALGQYEEFLYRFETSPDRAPYFARFPVRRSQKQLQQAMQDVYATCVEMAYPNTRVYPQPAWTSCRFCMFKDPCQAHMEGDEKMVEAYLASEFRTRKPYEPTESFGEE